MTRELSVLMVSYHFPPSAAVGGKRVARFCRYLPEFGFRPTVLTIDEESCGALDRSFCIPNQLEVERVRPNRTILDWYKRSAESRRGAQLSQENGNGGGRQDRKNGDRLLRRHLLAALQFPDTHRGWYRPAVSAADEIVASTQVDAVFSSGPPWTTHAIAHAISRRHKLPWVADFRDAWACDAWRKYAFYSAGMPRWRDRLDLWVEDRWIRRAALVVCTTDRHRNALLSNHPRVQASRIVTVPNGFDDECGLAHVVEGDAKRERVLLHAGNLYGARRVGSFCRAVEILVESGRLSPDAAKVIFMGETDSEIERDARGCAPRIFGSGFVAFRPAVNWDEAQQAVSEASVLLIFQGDHPTAVPAKFFEYLRTGKPILAIAKDGALKDLIVRTGSGVVADPDDPTAIASAIGQVLATRPRAVDEVEETARPFHFRNLTADLAANIRRVVPRSI